MIGLLALSLAVQQPMNVKNFCYPYNVVGNERQVAFSIQKQGRWLLDCNQYEMLENTKRVRYAG